MSLKQHLSELQCSSGLFQAKLDELESLQQIYVRKSYERSEFPHRKKEELMRRFQVHDALEEFRKRRGYIAIIDTAGLGDSAVVQLPAYRLRNIDVEFVNFYNARYSKTIPSEPFNH